MYDTHKYDISKYYRHQIPVGRQIIIIFVAEIGLDDFKMSVENLV